MATDGTKLDGIANNANNYSLPLAANGTRGGVQIGYAENGKNYPVELSSEKMFVNVPWTDNNTTYSAGDGLTLSGTTFSVTGGEIPGSTDLNTYRTSGIYPQNANADAVSGSNYPTNNAGILQVINDDYGNGLHTTQLYSQYNSTNYYHRTYYNGTWQAWRNLAQDTDTVYSLPLAADGTRGGAQIGYAENGKNYPVELSSEKMFVNVPWTDTVYTLPTAAANTLGGIEVGFTTNSGARNYAVQLSGNDAYVNVPWSDTNTDTNTTYSLSAVDAQPTADDATIRLTAGGSGSGSEDVVLAGNSNIEFRVVSAGTIDALIKNDAIGNAKLANMAANTIKGAVSAGDPVDLTPAQVRTMINVADGAQVNVGTNISITENTTTVTVASSTGSNDTIAGATSSLAGVVTNAAQTFGGKKTFGGGAKLADNANLTFGTGDDYLIDFTGAHLIIHQNVSTTNDIEITSTTDTTQFLFDVSGGSFHAEGDIVAFSTSTTSDINLKQNIQVVDSALQKVQQLRGVTFDWKDEERGSSAGVIAQEVEEVFPVAVKEIDRMNKGEEFYKHVDYNTLHALLIEAIKEQQEQIEALKAEVAALKK